MRNMNDQEGARHMDSTRRGQYKGPVRLVIFDWAGTTVDHGCFAPATVFIEVFGRHGIELSMAQAREPMGMDKRDHIQAIMKMPAVAELWRAEYGRDCAEQDIDALFADFKEAEIEVVRQYSEPIAGMLQTMAWLRERDIKIGSTTGYFREIMDVLVPHAAEFGYEPDAIVCSTDVPAGRPAPWMVYQNMMDTGVYPVEAVVKVGDTIADVLEGLNAGVWSVGVTRTGNEVGLNEEEVEGMGAEELAARIEAAEKRLREAGADYVIESVEELPELIGAIEGCKLG